MIYSHANKALLLLLLLLLVLKLKYMFRVSCLKEKITMSIRCDFKEYFSVVYLLLLLIYSNHGLVLPLHPTVQHFQSYG